MRKSKSTREPITREIVIASLTLALHRATRVVITRKADRMTFDAIVARLQDVHSQLVQIPETWELLTSPSILFDQLRYASDSFGWAESGDVLLVRDIVEMLHEEIRSILRPSIMEERIPLVARIEAARAKLNAA
jgi:hypothetical protein